MRQTVIAVVGLFVLTAISCGSSEEPTAPALAFGASGQAGAAGETGAGGHGIAGAGGSGANTPGCEPPDVLIALDRSLTMSVMPQGGKATDSPAYASSKFAQALKAINDLVADPLDTTIRFGFEMWPKDPGGCETLASYIGGNTPTNPDCEEGEILVAPMMGASEVISKWLNSETAHLCKSTPTGLGLQTAASYLTEHKDEGRDQYIMLVTDGADWDVTCPDPDPITVVSQLADDGIKTFVVGFSADGTINAGGVGEPFLNDMACAGQTAVGFPDSCTKTDQGYRAKDSKAEILFLSAEDAAALSDAFVGISKQVCCNCNF